MKKRMKIFTGLVLAFLAVCSGSKVWAAESGMEYITIMVDATDDNNDLQYAIDEPVNFTPVNTFTIPAGTSHTIYVKDAAGNITSQEYNASWGEGNQTVIDSKVNTGSAPNNTYGISMGEGDQEINIDLELGMKTDGISNGNTSPAVSGDYKNYEYLTDTVVEKPTTAVQSKTTTNGSDTAEKVFYTIATAEGETFYLVIDQGSSNAVHLLNTVTLDDLKSIAEAGTGVTAEEEKKEDSLLEALKSSDGESASAVGTEKTTEQNSSNNNMIILLLFVAAGAGGYYYLKIYKKKKNDAMDAMDAMDMNEFQPEEDEEDEEELEFDDYDEDKKQQLLDELISSDGYSDEEELLEQNPEQYAQEESNEYTPATQEEIYPRTEEDNREAKDSLQDSEVSRALSEAEEYDEELDGVEEEE